MMAKRYRIYSERRRRQGDSSHYLRGPRSEHSWASKEGAGTYTASQAVQKAEHVNRMVRSNTDEVFSRFSIEVVDDDTEN